MNDYRASTRTSDARGLILSTETITRVPAHDRRDSREQHKTAATQHEQGQEAGNGTAGG